MPEIVIDVKRPNKEVLQTQPGTHNTFGQNEALYLSMQMPNDLGWMFQVIFPFILSGLENKIVLI